MTKMNNIFLATGGSGGHIFPAITIAKKLAEHDYRPIFLGDSKISKFKGKNKVELRLIKSSPVNKKVIIQALFLIVIGVFSLYITF